MALMCHTQPQPHLCRQGCCRRVRLVPASPRPWRPQPSRLLHHAGPWRAHHATSCKRLWALLGPRKATRHPPWHQAKGRTRRHHGAPPSHHHGPSRAHHLPHGAWREPSWHAPPQHLHHIHVHGSQPARRTARVEHAARAGRCMATRGDCGVRLGPLLGRAPAASTAPPPPHLAVLTVQAAAAAVRRVVRHSIRVEVCAGAEADRAAQQQQKQQQQQQQSAGQEAATE